MSLLKAVLDFPSTQLHQLSRHRTSLQ
ncbi:hypothetical protein WG66_003345 [Moniliophthora roreri]|nr:hypothetical protein WG66_003345 [Moniliophthora roreri]